MRVPKEQINFLKNNIKNYLPEAKIYLFGSRVYNDKKGGDMDILVIASKELSRQDKRNIKIAFYQTFGDQKIDITSFNFEDNSPFKNLALLEGIEL